MRLRTTLIHLAGLLSAGCIPFGGSSCPDTNPPPTTAKVTASAADACELAQNDPEACAKLCASAVPGGELECDLPVSYLAAYEVANPEPGVADASEADAGTTGVTCPAAPSGVVVTCVSYPPKCEGRRTEGIAEPDIASLHHLGESFAARAYLEAASVHAFARLERELAAHGAPSGLLSRARSARRDEVRHARTMARFARRFGGRPRSVPPLAPMPVRSLLAIAVENAVEGCVRETYGALAGLVEARTSPSPDVRRAMDRIAADECRHAELAWAVARWALPRLDESGRREVARAAQAAIDELARCGDARAVTLLRRHVWNAAA